MSLHLETFSAGPLDTNVYLLWDDIAQEAVVVDPSIEADDALERARELRAAGIRLAAIWNTHGHFDHIYDNARWQGEFGAPIAMHPADGFLMERLQDQSAWFGLPIPEVAIAETALEDGQILHVGGHESRVMTVPGHSPGSVALYFPAEGFVIGGDVLFRGGVGRTDLPGASADDLKASLDRLLTLPPSTRVLPGHGEETTIEHERQTNPYCRYPFHAFEELR